MHKIYWEFAHNPPNSILNQQFESYSEIYILYKSCKPDLLCYRFALLRDFKVGIFD